MIGKRYFKIVAFRMTVVLGMVSSSVLVRYTNYLLTMEQFRRKLGFFVIQKIIWDYVLKDPLIGKGDPDHIIIK